MENQEQIVIDDKELVDFIINEASKEKVKLSEQDVLTVLNLEFEFLKLKGVIEE